ncbi:MAG: hypothetical protein WC073_14925, partial [Sterolibacterium sp.]
YDVPSGVHGYKTTDAQGNWTDYNTTYGANGSYDQTWTKNDGSHGENDKSVDGSTLTSMTNPDGSSTTNTFDASTGVHGYEVKNVDGSMKLDNFSSAGIKISSLWSDGAGNESIEYYRPDGSVEKDSWQTSDGNHGDHIFGTDGSSIFSSFYFSDGSYDINTSNPDGSQRHQFYSIDEGIHEDIITYADGAQSDTWQDDNGSYGKRTYDPINRESLNDEYDAATGLTTHIDIISAADGSVQHYAMTRSDGSYNNYSVDATTGYSESSSLEYESDGSWVAYHHTSEGQHDTSEIDYSNGSYQYTDWDNSNGISIGESHTLTYVGTDGSYSRNDIIKFGSGLQASYEMAYNGETGNYTETENITSSDSININHILNYQGDNNFYEKDVIGSFTNGVQDFELWYTHYANGNCELVFRDVESLTIVESYSGDSTDGTYTLATQLIGLPQDSLPASTIFSVVSAEPHWLGFSIPGFTSP